MGCDIHPFAEVRRNGTWHMVGDVFPLDDWAADYYKKTHGNKPFDNRDYSVFGFLANVRNYSDITPLSKPKGLPEDMSAEVRSGCEDYDHSASWLTLRELLSVDYDAPVEDRRVTRQIRPNVFHGGCTAEPGGGTMTTLREFLGTQFMSHLEILKTLGNPDDVRVVFWFDS